MCYFCLKTDVIILVFRTESVIFRKQFSCLVIGIFFSLSSFKMGKIIPLCGMVIGLGLVIQGSNRCACLRMLKVKTKGHALRVCGLSPEDGQQPRAVLLTVSTVEFFTPYIFSSLFLSAPRFSLFFFRIFSFSHFFISYSLFQFFLLLFVAFIYSFSHHFSFSFTTSFFIFHDFSPSSVLYLPFWFYLFIQYLFIY